MASPSPLTCFTCKQEVRWGWRHGRLAWWHREDVGHAVILGEGSTPELLAAIDSHERRKAAEKAKKDREDVDEEAPVWVELPEPEILAHDIDPASLTPQSGTRQMCNLIAKTDGWELISLRQSRGPYMGARGDVLSISDQLVLKARGPVVDGSRRYAVASWRDGGFKVAYEIEGPPGALRLVNIVNSTELKNWIKGTV